ncbi:MAG: carbohydrate-binding family 9-like protein [Chloroflexi bacterium]|nr:carbohydrate-binding family 9-like protein [Chloroflexota bacterium]
MLSFSDLPIYRCRRVEQPLARDGDLAKPVWRDTLPIVLKHAQGNGEPQQQTTVRGCWDGATLYLAFDCADTDIRATMTQRDSLVWQEEAVEAFIAPYGDLIHYFEFQCNPLNTVNDVRVTNPNARGDAVTFDRAWTCQGWQTATRNTPRGWASEWAIPLHALLADGAQAILSGEVWRVNLFRIDRAPIEEYSAWSPNPLSPIWFHRPQFFGYWSFE